MPSRLPLLTLIVEVPGDDDRRIDIFDWRTVIGRSSKNDVQLVARQVSKIHAAIEIEDGVPYIRDLGSRNGVDVNGAPIARSRALSGGDIIELGEARLMVDVNSVIFQPAAARDALQQLLDEEAKLRRRRRTENREAHVRHEFTVNESHETTRQAGVLIGRALGDAHGAPAVVRLLRIADEFGPRDTARVHPFVLETELGHRLWIRPLRDIEILDPDGFIEATDVWIDEVEDFAARARNAQILTRRHLYLPNPLKVVSVAECGLAPDGLPLFSEASALQPLVLAPA